MPSTGDLDGIIRTKDTLSHAIEYYVASPLLDVILRGIPEKTIFLDATLSPEVKAITRALGGSIYRKITASNVTVKANYSASVGQVIEVGGRVALSPPKVYCFFFRCG